MGQRGVTQGGTLSPMILNLVVDAVLRYWATVVAATEGVAELDIEGFEQDIQRLAAYLYANYGPLASTQSDRLHRVFDVLTELFYRVGLCTNTEKR